MRNKWLGLVSALCVLIACLCSVVALADGESIAEPTSEEPAVPEPIAIAFSDLGSQPGDVDRDGEINMKDVLALRKHIAGAAAISGADADFDEKAADVDGDGSLTMKDVLLLRKFIAGWDVTLIGGGDVSEPVSEPVSDVSEETSTVSEPETSEGERSAYVYGDDGEPYMNFIDDPNCSLGVWWWHTADGNNATLRDKYLNFLAANGTTQIYYYCAYDIQKSAGRATTYTFVKAAADLGMTVAPILDDFDMAGSKSYAREELTRFKAGYQAYQSAYPDAPLAGFHCDIEPHQINGKDAPLESLTQAQLQGYADNFLSGRQPLREAGIPIEVDLNCQWNRFGGENITYGGYTGIYNVIAHYVDSMCLMAYRDTAEDILALGDVAYAAAKDAGTRLVFAVETGAYSFNQPYEEFAQEDKEYMYEEFAKVYAALKDDHPAGGYGLAVHQHRTWYDLKKRDA